MLKNFAFLLFCDMEEIKTKGIVIKAVDYKDSDKIVTIFSADFGLIKARVRGVKKAKAKLAFAVQPFALIEFMLAEKGGFYTVINATSIDQFFNITFDFDNYIFMLGALEVCEKTVKQNSPEPKLFMLLLNSLKEVCYNETNSMNVFIKFMIEALRVLGFNLEFKNCACCGEKLSNKIYPFSYDYNGMLCPKCSNRNDFLELTVGEFAILEKINFSDISNLRTLKFMSRADLVSIISLLVKVFRIRADEEIETIKQFL